MRSIDDASSVDLSRKAHPLLGFPSHRRRKERFDTAAK